MFLRKSPLGLESAEGVQVYHGRLPLSCANTHLNSGGNRSGMKAIARVPVAPSRQQRFTRGLPPIPVIQTQSIPRRAFNPSLVYQQAKTSQSIPAPPPSHYVPTPNSSHTGKGDDDGRCYFVPST